MRALRYFFTEASAGLWRGRGPALASIATIAAALFVLGLVLVVHANLQRVVEQWSRSAELSVYLADGVRDDELGRIEAAIDAGGAAAERQFISKRDALALFQRDFPDLSHTAAALPANPFPASVEVRLRPGATGVDELVQRLRGMPGVADVRYDRDWLSRLNRAIGMVRSAGVALVAILALAAAMTVATVVRLGAAARRHEIEIMQLVGAPLAYIRGPLVTEGILQGGLGALLALLSLGAGFLALRPRFEDLTFLSAPLMALLVAGGMAVGWIGAYAVARRVR